MSSLPVLGHCEFAAVANDNGLFVGRCRQFPDMRTKPHTNRLDAVDAIIAAVADKLRRLDAATTDISKGARRA